MEEQICGADLIAVAPPPRHARRMTTTDRRSRVKGRCTHERRATESIVEQPLTPGSRDAPTVHLIGGDASDAQRADRGRPVSTFGTVLCAGDASANGRAARRHAALLARPAATIDVVPAARLTRGGRSSVLDACAGHDLLVLGAGASACEAAERAPIPVLIARSCRLGTELTDTILVPVGDSVASSGAVELAGRLAAAHGGTVTVLAAPPRDPALQWAIAASRRILLRATGATARVVGDPPAPEQTIPAAAAAAGASLVVLGSGPSAIERRTTAHIAGCLGCSVLVVPAPGAGQATARSRAACTPTGTQHHLHTAIDDVALLSPIARAPIGSEHTTQHTADQRTPAPFLRTGSTDRTSMPHHVLVVSNEDLADAERVPHPIRALIDDADEIYVVAPTLTTRSQWLADDNDGARRSADERLRTVFDHMQADGLEARGAVGAENQITAIGDALAQFDADLIVLRLHARGSDHENWREHRIAGKVRSHFDVPTIALYFDSEGHVVDREDA
jgi:hypothetical protein